MADLVADYGSDRAIIVRRVRIHIEKRRLQDRGWKVQCILQRQINRVHGLRRHPPLARIDWLMQFRKLALVLEQTRALSISQRVAFYDPGGLSNPPTYRDSQPRPSAWRVYPSLWLWLWRHPAERVDPLAECRHEILDQRLYPGLVLRGK